MAPTCATTRWAKGPRAAGVARRVAAADGFTLIELLAAIVVLTVGILAVGTVIASSTRESGVSERQQTMIDRGQKEIERIESLSYGQIADKAVPTSSSSDSSNPLFYYSVSSAKFQWDQSASAGAMSPSNSDALVVDAANGGVQAGPTPWNDGRLSGNVYDFVTWVTDPHCGPGCPASNDYKRVTVEVTIDGGRPKKPILLSSLVSDPKATPAGTVLNGNANPLDNPTINCQDASGHTVSCTNSVGSASINKWYMTDTAAPNAYAAPSANHATRPTVASTGTCTSTTTTGCPVPDLLNTSPPPAPSPTPPLYNYSNEQTQPPAYVGGRVLHRDVPCSQTPTSTDNTKGERWVSAPLSASLVLTGNGGMTLNTQTLGGTAGSVTLCVAVYDVPNSITNLISSPPTLLGVVSYTLSQWPTAATPISFTFGFLSSGTVTLASGHRVGLRIWDSSVSGSDIAVVYDHPSYVSELELESQ